MSQCRAQQNTSRDPWSINCLGITAILSREPPFTGAQNYLDNLLTSSFWAGGLIRGPSCIEAYGKNCAIVQVPLKLL